MKGFRSHPLSLVFVSLFLSSSLDLSFYSGSLRDVLPFTLKLPEAIASARTPADLEEIAILGAGLFSTFILSELTCA